MTNNSDLLKSAEELCKKAELHRQMMRREHGVQHGGSEGCACQDTAMKLRQAICESIAVIEDTRKAFKSKRLEMLRKKLIRLLAEEQ